MSTVALSNDTSTSSPYVTSNVSDVTTSGANSSVSLDVLDVGGGGCREDGAPCDATQSPLDLGLCIRLAPPPVPPWLRDSPARLHQLTKHCRSWTLYHELCTTGTSNSTWGYPRHDETSESSVEEKMVPGIQWVIPALALVVVLLLLLLAMVLYKYYSRPDKKWVQYDSLEFSHYLRHGGRMYRVSGAGYRCKPSHSGDGWAGGPLVESETAESYLSQPAAQDNPAPEHRYGRSPVCRILEQTQYVATPTEDQHRPRPEGPPAFASPAYFLPALSWLRLPILRQSWPGGEGGKVSNSGYAHSHYDSALPLQCDCGEAGHHWPPAEEDRQWAESRADAEDPEYSEIPETGPPPHYSFLNNQAPYVPSNRIGPYEYEMQETANGHAVCDCGQGHHQHHHPNQHLHNPQRNHALFRDRFHGNEHRYEKLWQCGEDGEGSGGGQDHESHCPSDIGTCENGWLSRYRLPSPCVIGATDPAHGRDLDFGHAHWAGRERLKPDNLTSDSDLLPCECSTGEAMIVLPSDTDFPSSNPERTNGRTEVKYINPMFEGRGGRDATHPPTSSPLLSRLWGYIGLSKQ